MINCSMGTSDRTATEIKFENFQGILKNTRKLKGIHTMQDP